MQSQTPQNDSPYKNHEQFQDEEQEQENYELNVIPGLTSQSSQYSDPPMLIYSYSGISNASSTPQLTLHASRMSEQPSHLMFIKSQKLYSSLQKLVLEAKDTLLLQDDIILYMMYLCKWSKDRLHENYISNTQMYVNLNNTLRQKKSKQNKVEGICAVCETKDTLIQSIFCNHSYCQTCWKQYIKGKLNDNLIFFGCMNKCDNSATLLHGFVERYFPQLFQQYRKMVCINYVITNNSISFCPGKNQACDLFCEKTQTLFDSSVQCQCGQYYCFYCRAEPHYPASCDDVKKWQKLLNGEQGNNKWIQQNTKTCPSCKSSVQKYIGCSKIKCLCGTEFCYQCNAKWDQTHKSNKGDCVQQKKKSSAQIKTQSINFIKLVQQSMSITRTQKKHMSTLKNVLQHFKQENLVKFHGVRKQVSDAWFSLKWGNIVTFLYKKRQIETFMQEQFIQSIFRLMEPVQRLQMAATLLYSKQLMAIGDQLMIRRQALRKNKQFWIDAWRGS